MDDLLARLFERLDQADIRYCLIRDAAELDTGAELSELDLLVQPDQMDLLRHTLAGLGYIRLPALGHAPHHFFVTYDEASDRWLKLDVVTELAYGRPIKALRTGLATNCLNRRRRHGITFVPAPEDELVALLLHCTLDKGEFAESRRQRLQALRRQITDESYLSELLDRYWSPGESWPRLAAQIDAGAWEAILASRERVAAHLAGGDPLGTLAQRVRGRLLRKLDRAVGFLRPRALSVALLAPDGAGKSTLAASIQNSFYFPVRLVYMGLYGIRGIRQTGPGVGFVIRLLTQWRRFLAARYHQGRGRLVIFDRYTYDALLATRRQIGRLKRFRRWLLGHACPSPDLILLLDAPGTVLYARKREHSAEALEAQRQGYLALRRMLPQMVVIDATRDAEQVRREVTARIWQGYLQRFGENGLG